jgi:glycerol uptake facilitator-like aquaporin
MVIFLCLMVIFGQVLHSFYGPLCTALINSTSPEFGSVQHVLIQMGVAAVFTFVLFDVIRRFASADGRVQWFAAALLGWSLGELITPFIGP